MTISITDVLAQAICHVAPMPQGAAEELAVQLTRAAAALGHGGADYYLPTFSFLNRDERNERIRREFNGRNLKEVSRKYGVDKRTVYRIVRSIPPADADEIVTSRP